ncbi:hypothetical protein [Streptomyces sp. NPDC060031]|uniref:hypothetical protein n=1 Tax=Streptomyces sp. NPDC060031 TaxID=3347043 RepID=UPI00368EFE52
MSMRREVCDGYQAAGRLRVPVAAWWWAAGSGLAEPADAGPGRWSRAVVEAAEAVRAALRGPCSAGWAADRLTRALEVPLPLWRPRATASAVGYLVKAGLLVYLGGASKFPTCTRTRSRPWLAAGTWPRSWAGMCRWARARPR